MLESQLKLGNSLVNDKKVVYDQMNVMKGKISECGRSGGYSTESCKEAFDAFKQELLEACDKWTEDQRNGLDEKFNKI